MTITLLRISRVSSFLLLITGGHMAGTYYTVETLTGSTRGHLVVGMAILWFMLTGLIEIGGRKLTKGFSLEKVREPARAARPYLLTATVVALLLLVDGGLLASGFA